jgi:hypothetical protein
MGTQVSTVLRAVADGFVKNAGYASAVLAGLVPDSRHLANGGYHCSVEDLKAHGNGGDYSNTRPDDKNFNPKYCAAYDVTLSRADMIRSYQRVYAVWKDRSDPRRKYINCINTWPGAGDAVRIDFYANKVGRASDDHKWHVHGEIRRRYLNDAKAGRAVLSVLNGEGKAAWIAREETPAKGGVNIPAKPAPAKTAPAVRHAPGSRVLQYVPGRPVLSGEDVAYVQRYIGASKAGPADGVAGAKFRAAVTWYQKMRGLAADGQVGHNTWAAMGVQNKL